MKLLIYFVSINVIKLIFSVIVVCLLLVPQKLKIYSNSKKKGTINEITINAANAICKGLSNFAFNETVIEEIYDFPNGTNVSYELYDVAKCKIEENNYGVKLNHCLCSNLLWILVPVIVGIVTSIGAVIDIFTIFYDHNKDFCDSQQAHCTSIYQFFFCIAWIIVSIVATVYLSQNWGFWYQLPDVNNYETYFEVPTCYEISAVFCYLCAIIFALDGAVMIWITSLTDTKNGEHNKRELPTKMKTCNFKSTKTIDEKKTGDTSNRQNLNNHQLKFSDQPL